MEVSGSPLPSRALMPPPQGQPRIPTHRTPTRSVSGEGPLWLPLVVGLQPSTHQWASCPHPAPGTG